MANSMDLNTVYWFVKVVDLGSMTKAAKYGGCAVSSVSDRIKQLEEALNVRLLERSTRQLRLTEAGEVFYERARASVESAEAAKLAVESWHEEPAGSITVSASPEMTRTTMLSALQLMTKRYPKIKTRLILTTERSDLLKENIDLAIRVGELDNSQLIARKITTMALSLVATEAYLKSQKPITHPRDLENCNCIPILSLISGKSWPWVLSKEDETINVMPKGNIETSSVGSGLDLALADMGIAVVSDVLLLPAQQAKLKTVLPDWKMPSSPVWAVYPSKSHLSPKVRAFVDVLQEAMVGK